MGTNAKCHFFNIGGFCAAIIVLFSGLVLSQTIPEVDDIPYSVSMEDDIVPIEEFCDSESELDYISDSVLIVQAGEGNKVFSAPVGLRKGDAISISFTAENNTSESWPIYIDLSCADENTDLISRTCVFSSPGKEKLTVQLPFSHCAHPEEGILRIYTDAAASLEISSIAVNRMVKITNSSTLVRLGTLTAWTLSMIALAYLSVYVIVAIKRKGFLCKADSRMKWDALSVLISILLVALVLAWLYRRADLSLPMVYTGGDEMGVYYFAKVIQEGSLAIVTYEEGGITGADMFDYPMSDMLSFLIIRFISLFVKNPYTIVWLFYFLTHFLIAGSATLVCLKFGLSRPAAAVVGVLYAFSPYIQMRMSHMWLVPYYMIPPACYMAWSVAEGRVLFQDNPEKENRAFWLFTLVSFFCAFTGLYYAYFTCALLAVALVLRLLQLRNRPKLKEFFPCFLIFAVLIGITVSIIPNLLYKVLNGANPASELSHRGGSGTEFYGLKMVQMLLPRPGHRIGSLRNITSFYNTSFPLITENTTASLGVVAGIGFILSILWMLKGERKVFAISGLNLSMFLIGTIGGVGTCLSLIVNTPMRCYNRLSIVIMFLSLVVYFVFLEHTMLKLRKPVYIILCLSVLGVGLYDQTTSYFPPNYNEFHAKSDLIHQVEEYLESGDMIFTLPYSGWVTQKVTGSYGMHIGYLESEDLFWSYGAMQGREEAIWQETVSNLNTEDMIRDLEYAGYDGIYLDFVLYQGMYGQEQTEERIRELTDSLGSPLVSETGKTYFWEILNNKEVPI